MADLLITFVNLLFNVFILLILARVLLSLFPQYRYHPVGEMIFNLTDPIIVPIQRILPSVGMFDFSPMVAVVLLSILQTIIISFLESYLY